MIHQAARDRARTAAREALTDGPLTADDLAVLLYTTHLTGAVEAIELVADQPASHTRAFADALRTETENVLADHERSP